MSTTHLELNGAWTECKVPEACELLFHFPGTSVDDMVHAPGRVLLELLNTVQPYDWGGSSTWYWKDENAANHRDYDLPAVIHLSGGVMHQTEWWQHGLLHRGGDKPAVQHWNGGSTWYDQGMVHRDNGPAVIHADGRSEYWQHGRLISR